jgi:hypothetical protein
VKNNKVQREEHGILIESLTHRLLPVEFLKTTTLLNSVGKIWLNCRTGINPLKHTLQRGIISLPKSNTLMKSIYILQMHANFWKLMPWRHGILITPKTTGRIIKAQAAHGKAVSHYENPSKSSQSSIKRDNKVRSGVNNERATKNYRIRINRHWAYENELQLP